MVKRRTLGDGLTPEEEAFLNPGKSAPKKKDKPTPKATKRKEESPMAQTAIQQQPVSPPPVQAAPAALNPQFAMPGVMSLNTRISAEISTALLTASMQRKIQRLHPFTQQDIVAEALTVWLHKEGYLV
ncbi:hypothetical protein FEM03_08010 [Phragmitibacter flavus]|uniref:Uncharacterized protein n=1 Tax=Phragmitibacter flavus TaxID=2576071 RepID=A0A5R8KGN9_9BACT|nr:hypothetical protein [Phragmitibacter flavus]TLD71460.1 hypothetical protein FEM03_08010 [Phragmitibacter flavus]